MLNSRRKQDKEPIDNKMQNIPSGEKSIRMMFTAGYTYYSVDTEDNVFRIKNNCEVQTAFGWKKSNNLSINDVLICDNEQVKIKNIEKIDDFFNIYV